MSLRLIASFQSQLSKLAFKAMSIYYLDTTPGQILYPSSRKINSRKQAGSQYLKVDPKSVMPNSFPAHLKRRSATHHWSTSVPPSKSPHASVSRVSVDHGHGSRSISKSSLTSGSSNASSLTTLSSTDLVPPQVAPPQSTVHSLEQQDSTDLVSPVLSTQPLLQSEQLASNSTCNEFQGDADIVSDVISPSSPSHIKTSSGTSTIPDSTDRVQPQVQLPMYGEPDTTLNTPNKCYSQSSLSEDNPSSGSVLPTVSTSSFRSLTPSTSLYCLNNETATHTEEFSTTSALFSNLTLESLEVSDANGMMMGDENGSTLSASGNESTLQWFSGSSSNSSSSSWIDIEDDTSSSSDSCLDSRSQQSVEIQKNLNEHFPYPDPLRTAGDPHLHGTLKELAVRDSEARRYEDRPHSRYCQRRLKCTPLIFSRVLERSSDGTYYVPKSHPTMKSPKPRSTQNKCPKTAPTESSRTSSKNALKTSSMHAFKLARRASKPQNKTLNISLCIFSNGSQALKAKGCSSRAKVLADLESQDALMKSTSYNLSIASHAPSKSTFSARRCASAKVRSPSFPDVIGNSDNSNPIANTISRERCPSSRKKDEYGHFLRRNSQGLFDKTKGLLTAGSLLKSSGNRSDNEASKKTTGLKSKSQCCSRDYCRHSNNSFGPKQSPINPRNPASNKCDHCSYRRCLTHSDMASSNPTAGRVETSGKGETRRIKSSKSPYQVVTKVKSAPKVAFGRTVVERQSHGHKRCESAKISSRKSENTNSNNNANKEKTDRQSNNQC